MPISFLVAKIILFILCLNNLHVASASTDTIRRGDQPMNSLQTLVSANGLFELGFFSPGQSGKNNIYLGIWYKNISVEHKTVVWVANREYPMKGSNISNCLYYISRDGNLEISDGIGRPYALTSQRMSTNTSATLLDTGNLVLRDIRNSIVELWQSFDYPSDHFLPGMKLGFDSRIGKNWSLISWNNSEDPALGFYSTLLDSSLEFLVMRGSQKYWSGGRWNGKSFGLLFDIGLNSYISDDNVIYFTYSPRDKSLISRIVLDPSGSFRQFLWSKKLKEWVVMWSLPTQRCDINGLCRVFGICNINSSPMCQCSEGFEPSLPVNWSLNDWSQGCVRRTSLECRGKDRFTMLKNVKFPTGSESSKQSWSGHTCELDCINDCSCSAYAHTYDNQCFSWKGDLLGVEQLESGGMDLFIKVAANEEEKLIHESQGRRQLSLILALPIILTMLILIFIVFFVWRRKLKQRGKKKTGQDLLSCDFNSTREATKTKSSNVKNIVSGGPGGSWEVELPQFSLESITISTDNFSDANKLGQGGFGPVYKGTILNGQNVAIKRLSRGSGQGMEELRNEATLIAKLQHRNLVRLLGCCIEGEEKILIYEYMPNKSLDFFLFDPTKRSVLDWDKRIHIIQGISQGLVYLHEHSRMRIIHRDLKASNVLLDNQMNAKISDFGMARIFGGNKSQANTNRIVGTYGYMSPEYAMEGLFSIKSDVFSFGILLLEILSGERNAGFRLSDSSNLIEHAWKLWKSERGLELMDQTLGDSFPTSKALRCINVGLLCVQEQAVERPTMSDILIMLSNETKALQSPKQPAFCPRSTSEDSRVNNPTVLSVNDVTVSSVEGR
ncbi:hypothetical protein Sjap_014726 [Stephania japonica]|uniref:Receptor-like serine/threonine-protein kinase n=1 Tax=Stephania japonica TaxID=461633 RepID=A0AAP0NRR8_9MAGN